MEAQLFDAFVLPPARKVRQILHETSYLKQVIETLLSWLPSWLFKVLHLLSFTSSSISGPLYSIPPVYRNHRSQLGWRIFASPRRDSETSLVVLAQNHLTFHRRTARALTASMSIPGSPSAHTLGWTVCSWSPYSPDLIAIVPPSPDDMLFLVDAAKRRTILAISDVSQGGGVAALCWADDRKLLVLSYNLCLFTYRIPAHAVGALDGQSVLLHQQPLNDHFSFVTCMDFHSSSGLLALGGGSGPVIQATVAVMSALDDHRFVHEWSHCFSGAAEDILSEVLFSCAGDTLLTTCVAGDVHQVSLDNFTLERHSSRSVISAHYWNSRVLCALHSGDVKVDDTLLGNFRHPQISLVFDDTCFVLDVNQRRFNADAPVSKLTPEKLDAWKKLNSTYFGRVKVFVTSYLWYFRLPQFESPFRRVAMLESVYTLYQLCCTAPSEMYQRRIAAGKFSEALELAAKYNLDTDLVHRQRWLSEPISEQSMLILNDLSNSHWALTALYDRLPESADDAALLLNFAISFCSFCTRESSSDYLVLFEEFRSRLETYVELASGHYDARDFQLFRSQDFAIASLIHAQHGRLDILRVLMSKHGGQIIPFRFDILSHLPRTLPVSQYSDLLPCVNPDSSREIEQVAFSRTSPSSLSPILDQCDQKIHDGIILRAVEYPASSERVADWYTERAVRVDAETGFLSECSQLLSAGVANDVPGLQPMIDAVRQLSTLCYTLADSTFISLSQYYTMPEYERYGLFLEVVNDHNVSAVRSALLQISSCNFSEYIGDYVSSRDTLDLALAVIKLSVPPHPRLMLKTEDTLGVALQACNSGRHWDAHSQNCAWAIFESLPAAQRNETGQMTGLNKQLDILEGKLRASEALLRYGIAVGAAGDALLAQLRAAPKRMPRPFHWERFLRDLMTLRQTLLSNIPVEEVNEVFVQALLEEGELDLARQHLPKVRNKSRLIIDAARQYFNSANALDDVNLEMAEKCLLLISDQHDESTAMEKSLLKVCSLLLELDPSQQLVPLQLRLGSYDPLEIMNNMLVHNPQLSKDDRITTVYELLTESPDKKLLYPLMTRAAFSCQEYDLALDFAAKSGASSAKVAAELSELDSPIKDALFRYSLIHGDVSDLPVILPEPIIGDFGDAQDVQQDANQYLPLIRLKMDEPEAQDPDLMSIGKKAWSNFFGE